MGLLTHAEILAEMRNGMIKNGDPGRAQASSYDMVVGTVFRDGKVLRHGQPGGLEPIVIPPGEVMTMLTLEELHLPNDIAATAFAMNAQSSQGVLVINPGHVDPGYHGALTVKALNLRKVDFALMPGAKIFTVIFDRLDKPAVPAYAKNLSAVEKEHRVQKETVEASLKSLSDLLVLNAAFPTEKRVGELIVSHWATRVSFAIMILTFILAAVAAVAGVIAVWPKSSPSDAEATKHLSREVPAATPSEISTDRSRVDVGANVGARAAPTAQDQKAKVASTPRNQK